MSTKSDTVFDGMDTFLDQIYGTTKGEVRLHVLWLDMLAEVPALKDGGLRVIDIGAGKGQIARRLGELGHEVTLCEPSGDLLDEARQGLHDAGLAAHFVQSTAQELDPRVVGRFDLVVCHAVLEWLAEPEETLKAMVPLMRPDGFLSVMFWNRNAAVLKRILRGDLSAVVERGESSLANDQGATPLDPEAVRSWLVKAGLQVVSKAGIRMFHDLLPEPPREPGELERLLRLETELRKQEPFASLGQHTHFVCRRP